MTDRNDHTGSVLALAEALKARDQEKALRAIVVIQNYMGHMPSDLSALRYKILTGLLATAKREVGPVAYRHLHEAF